MTIHIDEIIQEIQRLEVKLEDALSKRMDELHGSFSPLTSELLREQQNFKLSIWKYLRTSNPLSIITAPIIYSLFIPFLIMDIFVSIYQYVCFPIYRINRVKRSEYFIFDRHHLGYLNLIERFNCTYCSYVNGLISNAREVASLTEAHWCPIKHATHFRKAHSRYQNFVNYGDAAAYRKTVDKENHEN